MENCRCPDEMVGHVLVLFCADERRENSISVFMPVRGWSSKKNQASKGSAMQKTVDAADTGNCRVFRDIIFAFECKQ